MKEALKLVARTKMKKAILIGAWALLAAGTAMVTGCGQGKPVHGIPKGWSVIGGDGDTWRWGNGVIAARSASGCSLLASSREYRDVTLSAIVGSTNRDGCLAFRIQDADNCYFVLFTPAGTPWPWNRDYPFTQEGFIALRKRTSGSEVTLASYQGSVFSIIGQSAKVAVTARGSVFEVRLNDVRVLRATDTNYTTGLIGLRICGDDRYPSDTTYSNLTFQ